jgi:hypothetical protein
MNARTPLHTGGCQCGAVRYAVYGLFTDPHICHCRMCQKAVGSFFAALAGVKLGDIEWTRGAPSLFRSSTLAERGFCAACGTPLTFSYVDSGKLNVTIGSLDHPEQVKPANQYGVEGRMPWFGELSCLPGLRTEDDIPAERLAKLKSHQHPDE